ncbi:LIM domain and actin-binding protein 1 [Liparis tanakae]|uniref:LIM domain and actin-binding protein 1 n=1 Tax=Liparis tanakae TaxID=230148 RepID=A0A4Z2F0Y2_9TELE|nr:LIM domain and actin-binding protein 1 [Liparis tanakae]
MSFAAPFGRRQWASQSLRVTAKEMSIVSPRGKNPAIAERFSRYQLAAEEGNAEKKKAVAEDLPSTLRSGNLSVLKKRWERQQPPPSLRAQPQTVTPADPQSPASQPAGLRAQPQTVTPADPQSPVSQPAGLRAQPQTVTPADPQSPVSQPAGLRAPSQIDEQPNTFTPTALPPDQDAEREPLLHAEPGSSSRLHSAPHEDRTHMETPSRAAEAREAEVSDAEKPSVPLNSLKMMFEKGANRSGQVSLLPGDCPFHHQVNGRDHRVWLFQFTSRTSVQLDGSQESNVGEVPV